MVNSGGSQQIKQRLAHTAGPLNDTGEPGQGGKRTEPGKRGHPKDPRQDSEPGKTKTKPGSPKAQKEQLSGPDHRLQSEWIQTRPAAKQ